MTLPKLDVRVRPFDDASGRPTKLLAFAELVIADAFVIKGIRVLKRDEEGNDEPFVVFPAEKGKGAAQDRWFDVAHPVTAEARAASIALVLERYRQARETPAAGKA
ncbi:MAG TPA: septation protein SpoVG family protein [Elusimicrobiota bacterium]|nr:septation protein SpoVG family protein [Elusimicrobiota bacterium]